MNTSYDVRVFAIEKRPGKLRTSYRVEWRLQRTLRFKRQFRTRALAESFRSKLVVAARDGVGFDLESGFPVTMLRSTDEMTWYEFACSYIDMKWPDASPKHRRSIAQSLTPATIAMTTSDRGMPDRKVLNKALQLAFNPATRDAEHPDDVARALRWLQKHSRNVSEVADPDVFREVISTMSLKGDGTRATPNTVRLRRTILSNAVQYAMEKKLLATNPFDEIKIAKPKASSGQVDRRAVPNPVQVRSLFRVIKRERPRLYAFFALLYFAALRPEEAANLREKNLTLPAEGWGTIHLDKATPEVAKEWTDSRTRGEQRRLKHRDDDTDRPVPCCPELTEILHWHLTRHGTATDGRLFRGQRDQGPLSSSVYGRAWAQAREETFTTEVYASPLAKRPYDLRHAAVSTWLNGGVEPTRVAEWAGHSVAVLLRVYAKCLDGGEQTARERVEAALGHL